MDDRDRAILDRLQDGIPIIERPYRAAARDLGIPEAELIARLQRLLEDGTLSRFGPMIDIERAGGNYCLCAMAVPARRVDEVAALVNAYPEVAHNYQRDHRFSLWFVLACESNDQIAEVVGGIEATSGCRVLCLPKLEEFFVGLRLRA